MTPGELAHAIIFRLILPICAFAALVIPAVFPRSPLARVLLKEVGPRPSGPHPNLKDCWICAGRWALIVGSIAVLDAGIVLTLIFIEATFAGSLQALMVTWAVTFGSIFTVLGLAALVQSVNWFIKGAVQGLKEADEKTSTQKNHVAP